MFTRIEILNMIDIQKDLWNKFLLNNPKQATVFHTQEWMQTLQEAHGYEPKYLTIMTKDCSLIAAIPFMIDIRFGIKNYLSMPYDTYGGVIGNSENLIKLTNIFKKLPGIGVRYIVDYNCILQDGEVVSTELVDITPDIDIIWNNFHKGNQRAIKSALKNNVIIQETNDNLEFFDRVPLILVNSIVKYMISPGYCIIYVAKFDNIPISISLFFIYGDMALYWAGTTNDIGRKLNAHHLLMWEAIQYSKTRGCKIFNFGASPSNADSLMQFKKSWGTTTHQYIKDQKVPILLYPLFKLRQVLHD